MLQTVRQHLLEIEHTKAKHHIDHHLGQLHQRLESGVYVPDRWLLNQAAGESDVNRKQLRQRRFRDTVDLVHGRVDRSMIAVMGPYSGGTSAVAGTLHRLGIRMGVGDEMDKSG
ncbi:MAG: hypothetical protein AAF989_05650, partial [Planctomycetota bacterium]